MTLAPRPDRTAIVWEVESGKECFRLKPTSEWDERFQGPSGWGTPEDAAKHGAQFTDPTEFRTACFSPDGKSIFIALGEYPDCTARIWDAESGKERLVLKGHEGPVGSAAYSPDGKWIVTASLDKTARIWESATGKQLQELKGHSGALMSASFSPDGKRVLTIGEGRHYLFTKEKGYHSAVLNIDTLEPVAGRLWDAATGKPIAALEWASAGGVYGGGRSIARQGMFSPDGRFIVTAGWRYWGSGSGASLHREPAGWRYDVNPGAGAPNVWDAVTGKFVRTLVCAQAQDITSIGFSRKGDRMLTTSGNRTAIVWHMGMAGSEWITLRGHEGPVVHAAFSPDERHVASASPDGTVRLWTLPNAHWSSSNAWFDSSQVAFSDDGQHYRVGSRTESSFWEKESGEKIIAVRKGHDHRWRGSGYARFSPDGRRVAVEAESKRQAWVHDTATGAEIAALQPHTPLAKPENAFASIEFSNTGAQVLARTNDGKVYLFETATGKELLETKAQPSAAWFTPDGRRLLTLSARAEEAAVLWDAAIDVVGEDVEHADEIVEEWREEDSDEPSPTADDQAAKVQKLLGIQTEIDELRVFKELAESISDNAKGQALLMALNAGFKKAAQLGAPRKALIFTESRRTQSYMRTLLEANGYKDRIVLFNGTNTDPDSKKIYQDWTKRHAGQDCVTGSPTADMRSALVEEFQERAEIMIATESAAEGVNLQFCNLVVNYDLPWNPQRIEQRIGRCHRYGQKHDVVVVNFLNRTNEADRRVFELLDQKFKLFDGVFGASDEVLGALESGVDFEKRINEIYQNCRTIYEIHEAFDRLQQELEEKIEAAMKDARTKLLENFDVDVQQRLRMRSEETNESLSRYGDWLRQLTQLELADCANFEPDGVRFNLHRLPDGVAAANVPLGTYRLVIDRGDETEHHYRTGHPLAEALIARAKERKLSIREVTFDYGKHPAKISLVENLVGQSGWLRLVKVSVTALETEDHLLFLGAGDDGQLLDRDTCTKLFAVAAAVGAECGLPEAEAATLDAQLAEERKSYLDEAMLRNQRYFDAEMQKLDLWAEDLKETLEHEIKEIGRQIADAKRELHKIVDLPTKLQAHKKVKDLEKHRHDKRKSLFETQDKIDADKDRLNKLGLLRLSKQQGF